jgi:cation:H+ antiporter
MSNPNFTENLCLLGYADSKLQAGADGDAPIVATLILAVGLVTLLLGGEILVRGASALAMRLRAAPLVAGLIVGFGTSAPELVLSVDAAVQGIDGLAIGTLIGANVANAFLVMGVLAIVAGSTAEHKEPVGPHTSVFLAAGTVVIAVLAADGTINRLDGALLLAVFAGFLFDQLRRARRDEVLLEEINASHGRMAPATAAVLVVVGLVLLPVGATIAVNGAVGLARGLGIAEAVIGLTVTSFGTTLPEVATAFAAGRRGHHALGIGNVIGSFLFNGLLIVGVVAAIQPVSMPVGLWLVALPAYVIATVVTMAVAHRLIQLRRDSGFLLVGFYVIYVIAASAAGI